MNPESTPKPREWSPHMWQGSDYFAFLSLMAKNRCAVHPSLWYVALIASVVTLGNTVLRWCQHSRHGRRIAATRITQSPIFLIGHWRTGTTLLHELMILDPRFTFPNTYQCMDPHHFLISESFVKRYMGWLLPDRRPMDNMRVGWDRPQEDEFALCLLGLPSPYADIAFPNRAPIFPGSLDLEGISPQLLAKWKRGLYRYLQVLTYHDRRRLVLKSPPHTARVRHLLDLFPDAKFVHIVRNPYHVYPSTVNLWKKFYRMHALQIPTYAGLEERIFRDFNTMYARLDEVRPHIPAGQFHEVKYEDLVADPIGNMRQIYDSLQLDEFDQLLPHLEDFLQRNKDYETNRWNLNEEQVAQVQQYWGHIIERYGYRVPAKG